MQCDIQEAFDKLSPDQQKLYFTLHSGHGQDPKAWPSRIHSSVSPREQERIREQHHARTGKEPSLISIFQTNCMEKVKGAAIFPHAARFNHCCNPNACFTWNSAIGKETIHAMSDIQPGDQITLSYCDMIHDKSLRTWELKHYGFVCDCRACTENEEDDTTFAYHSGQRRYRLQELDRETKFLRGRYLDRGAKEKDLVKKLLEMAALHQQEGDWTARLANVWVNCCGRGSQLMCYRFLDIALVCEFNNDLKMAALTAAKAVQVKKDCQGEDFPEYGKYVDVLRRIKSKLSQQKA